MVSVGEYYAKVKLGGQTLRVQIDTGSATLAVPVKECTSCKRGDMRYSFDESDSGVASMVDCEDDSCGHNTCSPFGCGKCSSNQACCAQSDHDKCAFHINFGDGSGAKGVLIRDELEWGDIKFPVTFGGIRSDSPDFERSQVDGILGMAYPSLACNPSCITPTFEAMRETIDIADKFTVCITYDSGKIVLGDYDPALSTKKISWVPLQLSNPPSFYSFPLIGNLKVDGVDLPLPSYSCAIVDSGTTLIVFSHATFDKFKRYLQTKYCDVPGLCANGKHTWFRPAHCTSISDEDRAKLPTLTFSVQGFDITLTPDDYLINYKSKGSETWCLGIMALDAMSGGVDVILGNTVMKKYVTVYDRENKRVGFAESDKNCGLGAGKEDNAELPVPVPNNGEGKGSGSGSGENGGGETGGQSQQGGASGDQTPGGQPGAGSDEKGKAAGATSGTGSSSEVCDRATDCSSCADVTEAKCRWNASSERCEGGDPELFMCTLSGLTSVSKVLLLLGVAFVAIGAVVVIVGVGLHSYLKWRGSPEEEGDVVRPLADNEVDTTSAFTIEDEEAQAPSQRT